MKEIFLMAHLRTSCQRKLSPNFFPLLANSQWKVLWCLGSLATAGGANCPLLPGTVNVKLGPPLGLYFSFSIPLVFSSFLRFSEYLLVIYSHPHPDSPSFLRFFFWVLLVWRSVDGATCKWMVTARWCPWVTSHCDSHHKRIIVVHLSLYNDRAT